MSPARKKTTKATRRTKASGASTRDGTAAVEAFLAALEHPCKAEIRRLRALILDAGSGIAEGIKWNAPSFRTSEDFATLHLRRKEGVGVIFHLGAKKRTLPVGGLAVDDPTGLLEWLAPDRAVVAFADAAAIEASRKPFQDLVRRWITLL